MKFSLIQIYKLSFYSTQLSYNKHRCHTAEETIMHCLRDCPFIKSFWNSTGFTDQAFFQEVNLYVWLRHGIDGPTIFFLFGSCLVDLESEEFFVHG
jgi:hypothetical protein